MVQLARARIIKRLTNLPIFIKIAFGNTVIIVIGAVGGTLITRQFSNRGADPWLIIIFAFVGTRLSLVTNWIIVFSALRPLYELRKVVERIRAGQTDIDTRPLIGTDPNISLTALTLNTLIAELEDRNLKLRALSSSMITAQEEERKSIARSLHDDTGQALSTLVFQLERLEDKLPAEDAELRDKLTGLKHLAANTLGELRKIIYGLRPTILDDLGLVSAIRWYARTNFEPAGIELKIEADEANLEISPDLATILFRISQEAINNIVKHANASQVAIRIWKENGRTLLSIQDNGIGFDLTQVSTQALKLQHLGLLGVQERAKLADGEAIIDSRPGQGTCLQISLPGS